MPRGKRITIEREIKDPQIDKIKSIKIPEIRTERSGIEKGKREKIKDMVQRARSMKMGIVWLMLN